MELVERIKKEAKRLFSGSRGSHDWEHTMRVYKLCLHIGKQEKVDLNILKIAAILHDIGREYQDRCNGTICHAEKGAVLAERLLVKFDMSSDEIDRIVHCVKTHRFRGGNIPTSIEAKVLFDADKLDSIGAIGVGRAFLFAGEIGAKLHNKDVDLTKTKTYTKEDTAYREFTVKLRRIREKMLTKEGRRIANKRHEFMVNFFNRLNEEVDGRL